MLKKGVCRSEAYFILCYSIKIKKKPWVQNGSDLLVQVELKLSQSYHSGYFDIISYFYYNTDILNYLKWQPLVKLIRTLSFPQLS